MSDINSKEVQDVLNKIQVSIEVGELRKYTNNPNLFPGIKDEIMAIYNFSNADFKYNRLINPLTGDQIWYSERKPK